MGKHPAERPQLTHLAPAWETHLHSKTECRCNPTTTNETWDGRTHQTTRHHPLTPHKKTMNTRQLLETTIQLHTTLPDPHDTLLYVKANPLTPHNGNSPTNGLPFRIHTLLDNWDDKPRTKTSITSWAAAWAWSWCHWRYDDPDTQPTGDPLLWLHANLDWAENHWPAMKEFTKELQAVHTTLQQAHGLNPINTGRTCPTCETQLQHQITDNGIADNYTCPNCQSEYTPQGLAQLTQLRLANADAELDRDTTAHLLGINRSTLRSWIRRGNLTEHNGKINLAQTRQLLETRQTKLT